MAMSPLFSLPIKMLRIDLDLVLVAGEVQDRNLFGPAVNILAKKCFGSNHSIYTRSDPMIDKIKVHMHEGEILCPSTINAVNLILS